MCSDLPITYQRKIIHCERSPYVKLVTIKTVEPAKNSDFLDRITFEEMGWNAISQRGLHEPGKKVMFIPPESVLPTELSDALEVTKYLAKGKVRVAKLRGNRSEGLIVDAEKVGPYLNHILKWEDPPTTQMRGFAMSHSEVPFDFEKFYKIPNLMNEPDTFNKGEKVSFSEKIHGTNVRCGKLKHPQTEKYQLYVGSHNIVLKEDEKNLYWATVKKIADKLPPDYAMYGEIFGSGVQHLHYDRAEPDIYFFAAMKNGEYLSPVQFTRLCEREGLPRVTMHPTVYVSVEKSRIWADLPSDMTKSHVREGVVIVSSERPGVMAKIIGFEYLTSRDKKKTERH